MADMTTPSTPQTLPGISDEQVDAYLKAQRETVEEADRAWGRPNVGGLHTNTVREACRNGLKAAIATQPQPQAVAVPAMPVPNSVQEIMPILLHYVAHYMAACVKFNHAPRSQIEEAESEVQEAFKPLEAALTALVEENHRLKFALDGVNAMRDVAARQAVPAIPEGMPFAGYDPNFAPGSNPENPQPEEPEHGQLDPRSALDQARKMVAYVQAFKRQKWGGLDESVDRQNLAMALDHLEETAAMLLNMADRVVPINAQPPAGQQDRGEAAIGYLPAYELGRLHSGHDAHLRSAKFGPSLLDSDVPVYLQPHVDYSLQAAKRVFEVMGHDYQTEWDDCTSGQKAYYVCVAKAAIGVSHD